ncbi:MAG: alginate export family protein, partial [Betaproteobacteria bacterium]|nr:alginate export family protein [Betaproteobacteria bacterium]
MKFRWYFLPLTALSALAINPASASSEQKATVDFQATQPDILRIVQQVSDETAKPSIHQPSAQTKPSDLEKSLPAIAPKPSAPSASFHRRSNSYATNPDSDPPRYVRRLSDIG